VAGRERWDEGGTRTGTAQRPGGGGTGAGGGGDGVLVTRGQPSPAVHARPLAQETFPYSPTATRAKFRRLAVPGSR
jgi:hypothetical protein